MEDQHIESNKDNENSKRFSNDKDLDDENIAIDFSELKSKATNMFKSVRNFSKNTKTQTAEDESQEAVQGLDFTRAKTFTTKNKAWLIPLALLLFVIILSSYFRVMPAYLPITDTWAENSAMDFYRNNIQQSINAQYPNLPEQNRQALVEKELQNFLEQNKDQVNHEISTISQQFKDQLQDPNGDTYLIAIDPYYWLTMAQNYVDHGDLGDSYNEAGEPQMSLRNGRFGLGTTGIPFHPIASALVYKFLHFFSPSLSLMKAFLLMPAIIIALSLIPAFLVGRKLAGNIGGFFAALFIGINHALLRRSAGFADTDAYNAFFPLMILWCFLNSVYAKETKKRALWGSLAGLFTGLYAVAWLGYWYIFIFIFLSSILVAGYYLIQKRQIIPNKEYFSLKPVKSAFACGTIYFLSSALFVSLFAGFSRFTFLFKAPLGVINLKNVGISSVWPNVLTTVAEFNQINLSGLIGQMGGELFFVLGILGLASLLYTDSKTTLNKVFIAGVFVYYAGFLLWHESISGPIAWAILLILPILLGLLKILYKKEKVDLGALFTATILTLWIAGTVYGFSRGVRFSILMVPAFGIAFGICLGKIYENGAKSLSSLINTKRSIAKIVLIGILILLMVSPVNEAKSIGENSVPSMNDAWYNTLIKIKENSSDGIITSWWDFGHWFYAISERRVTFDGGGQGERIHWVGKTLLVDDEQASVGLLRMLNCGQEKPVHVIEEFLDGDAVKAVDILNEMMYFNNKEEATQYLQNNGFTQDQVKEILELTYCEDLLEQYFITSEDMVHKAGVWGHFGSWDFRRAAMYQNTVKKTREEAVAYLTENFEMSETEAQQIHSEIQTTPGDQWISPWPNYNGQIGCSQNGAELRCSLQGAPLTIDLNTKEAFIGTGEQKSYPNSIVFATLQGVEEKVFTQSTIGLSVILTPSNHVIISSPQQAKSMFTQLFFFNGHGLECFSKFEDVQQFSGGRIITWKVDFSCQQENIVYAFDEVSTEGNDENDGNNTTI